jgi:hypothetical protein
MAGASIRAPELAMLRKLRGSRQGTRKNRDLRKKCRTAGAAQKALLRKGGAMALVGGEGRRIRSELGGTRGIRWDQSPILESWGRL